MFIKTIIEKIKLSKYKEQEGSLIVVESEKDIPFVVKRVFWIYDVPEGCIRANHACRNSDLLLVCIRGRVSVELDNGKKVETYSLDTSARGLIVPRMTWMKTYDYSKEAILLVLASGKYDSSQYCEDYELFLRELNS